MINDKDKLKELRIELGASQNDLAKLLGLSSDRVIRAWEMGEKPITGPASLALEYIARGLNKEKEAFVPEFVVSDIEQYNTLDYEVIVRLWYPRFIGFIVNRELADILDDSVRKFRLEVDDDTYLIISQWIDPVAADKQIDEALDRARTYANIYVTESIASSESVI